MAHLCLPLLQLYNKVPLKRTFYPIHEIMALFVLRKLILQTHMCSHPVRLDVSILVGPFVYFMCANSEGSGETARMRRLPWFFAGRLCGKYHNLMRWFIYVFCLRTCQVNISLYGFRKSKLIRLVTLNVCLKCTCVQCRLSGHYRSCLVRVTDRFAHFPVRPELLRPRVVSPFITLIISPSYPESFRPLLDESFRPLSKLIFYWGYCDKFTVFVSFNEAFGHISLKNDRSFINWSKWYIYVYSV